MNRLTSRNHYNPCFWVALWNREYFRAWQATTRISDRHARDQSIWVLNLRSDRIYQSKAEAVHFHKGLGLAEISAESMLDWCKQWYPAKVDGLAEYLRQNSDSLLLDFEPTLHGVEQLEGYDAIMRAARDERLHSASHKGFLACGLMMHAMRYQVSSSMVEGQGRHLNKWQTLWLLKTVWANDLVLSRAVLPLAMGQWTLRRTSEFVFPLCDSPIIIHRDGLLAVLSPRLLLEIDLTIPQPEDHWILENEISPHQLEVCRAAILRNTFKELIAWDRETLEQWRRDPRCQERIEALACVQRRDITMAEAASHVAWGVMGFGRVPDDFEEWAPRVRDTVLNSEKGRAIHAEPRSKSKHRP